MQSDNTKRVGRFTINYLQLIDNGAFSEVVRARSTGGSEYAVKIIDKQKTIESPVLIKQVLRQMDIVKVVKSQLLVNVTDSIQDEFNYYFFMEYCKQGNLSKYMQGREKVGEMQMIVLMKHIVDSYSQLYKKNIIHRDLKPRNILLRKGIPIISDFGTAKFINLNKGIFYTYYCILCLCPCPYPYPYIYLYKQYAIQRSKKATNNYITTARLESRHQYDQILYFYLTLFLMQILYSCFIFLISFLSFISIFFIHFFQFYTFQFLLYLCSKEIELLTNFTGTLGYMAPEMCKLNPMSQSYYDYGVDIWSLGIIFYQMIEGKVPWTITNENHNKTIEYIRSNPLSLKRLLSYESKRLIRGCLQFRPEDRIKFEQLINHEIFKMDRQKFEYYENKAKQLKESVKLSPGNEEIQKYLSQRLNKNQYSIKVCQISQLMINKLDWEYQECHQIFHQYRDYEDRINVKTVQKMLGFEEAKIELTHHSVEADKKKLFYMNRSSY